MKTKRSKKTLIFFVIIGCITLTGLYLMMIPNNESTLDNCYFVGVASTFNKNPKSQYSNEMIQGIQLAANQVNQAGGVDGKKIKLVIQNDKNDPSVAMKTASNFARDQRILLVLGHYYSIPSLVGADIYQKNAIPVITASATYDQITLDNEWYYRTVPNNSYHAEFIGTYLGLNLQKWPVVIITEDDDFHLQISHAFSRTIQKYGMNRFKQFSFHKGTDNVLPQLINISNAIKRFNQQFIIFISAGTRELVELVRLLKSSPEQYDFKIVGTDSASSNQFIHELSHFTREKSDPGFYSDNLMTVATAIPGTGNGKTFQFYKDFYEAYHKIPSWVAASYYDALMLGAQAIQRAELTNDTSGIRNKRRKFRRALNEFYDHKHAFKGVTGSIYFNIHGDAQRPLISAHYQGGSLRPEYIQYQRNRNQGLSPEDIKQSLNNEIVVIDQTVMNKKKVVFATIQILSVEPFQEKNQILSTVDFYLKFQFSGVFDDHNICFENTQQPVSLTQPVMEKKKNGIIQRLYRVKANVYHRPNYQSFPFNQHELAIRFNHKSMTADYLTYVPILQTKNIKITPGWTVESKYCSLNTVENEKIPKLNVIKDNLYYTQVDANLVLCRQMNGIRYIFPFIIVVILLYGTFYIPAQRFSATILVIGTAFIVTTFYYYEMLSYINLPILVLAERCCLYLYTLSLLTFILAISISVCHTKGQMRMVKLLRYSGIIGFPIVLGIFLMIVF